MKKISFSVHNLLNSNKFALLVSFLFAITIWVNVSPQRTITINCPVTISTENTSAKKLGLDVVDGKTQNISVTIQGKWYNISDVSSKDIDISYSFKGITDAGKYKLEFSATKSNNNADYKISKVSPESVLVTLDHIVTKSFQIATSYNNIKVEDESVYSIGEPIINDDDKNIQIKGPEKKVNKIKKVVAEISKEETLSKTNVYEAELKFYNKKNKEVDVSDLTLPYTNVQVTLPLNEFKTVSITPKFEDKPNDSISVPYELSQKKIKLVGTKEAKKKINSIELEPISFNDLTLKDHKFKKKLILPSGISAFNGETYVKVTVDLSGYSSKKFEIKNFETTNNDKFSSTTVETKYLSVNVVGKKDVVEKLNADDLYIECDLSEAAANSGSVIINGSVKSKRYKNIWGTGDNKVRIRVVE